MQTETMTVLVDQTGAPQKVLMISSSSITMAFVSSKQRWQGLNPTPAISVFRGVAADALVVTLELSMTVELFYSSL